MSGYHHPHHQQPIAGTSRGRHNGANVVVEQAPSSSAASASCLQPSDGLINLEPLPSPDYTYTYDEHENLNDFFDDYLFPSN